MHIHLMAVGGTGMGALAGLLKAQGHEVTGCDTALYPPMSDYIARYGIPVATGFDPSHLTPAPDLVVIGNAIHADNREAAFCAEEGIPFLSMAEAIRRFAVQGHESLVVTGTHGKTTTAALCGWLLEASGMTPNLLVGGIATNFDASFRWGGGEWTVLEGDEYETAFFDKGPKFLHYAPSVLLLNNIELDHFDNFRDLRDLETAFVRLFGVVREGGTVIAGTESQPVQRLLPQMGRQTETFGLEGSEDWTVLGVTYCEDGTRFHLLHRGRDLGEFHSPLCGAHNLRNAVGALAACATADAQMGLLREALPGFKGVKRRQEVVYRGGGIVVLDDFAHHPTAIAETLKAFHQRFFPERIVACFEPRSFTCQTNLHQSTLPSAFALADSVFLGPMKASEKISPDRRLDLDLVAATLEASGKRARVVGSYDELLSFVRGEATSGAAVAFFSSGSYGSLPERLAETLRGGNPCR